jgi:Rps23 Pro-64 3,4-dihydroxylase Tpa1-like proline 4-hydroxylase
MQIESMDFQWKYDEHKVTVLDNPYCIIIDDLFGPEKSQKIFEHILSLREYFEPAKITYEGDLKTDEEYRKNTVCYIDSLYRIDTPDWIAKKEYRKRSQLLEAIDGLIQSPDMAMITHSTPFPMCKFRDINVWETQISRYGNDEDHYEWHYDRMSNDDRLITLVYYVNMEPKKFQGGELIFSDGLSIGRRIITSNSKECAIKPQNDRLVIFNSRTVHRVAPVTSSPKFEDGRFSVNIWCGIRKDGETISNY